MVQLPVLLPSNGCPATIAATSSQYLISGAKLSLTQQRHLKLPRIFATCLSSVLLTFYTNLSVKILNLAGYRLPGAAPWLYHSIHSIKVIRSNGYVIRIQA